MRFVTLAIFNMQIIASTVNNVSIEFVSNIEALCDVFTSIVRKLNNLLVCQLVCIFFQRFFVAIEIERETRKRATFKYIFSDICEADATVGRSPELSRPNGHERDYTRSAQLILRLLPPSILPSVFFLLFILLRPHISPFSLSASRLSFE